MRPEALNWSVENCPIGRTMELLGERWTVVVLREVFNGIRRFDDMRARTGIPRQVLANRLSTLVEQGVLRQAPYQEPGARQRHEYRLTEKGFDLYPVLLAVHDWGERYLSGPAGSPSRFAHAGCGASVHATLRCEDGHHVTAVRDVRPLPGPGAVRRDHAESSVS
ncbi:winged helix-turn-helix transcriptional regulator [Jiangella asiatica]|uniref:Transcriptional regulator n=1 Tax=Jiangella asiatica TaxID=2530372 RepID=A0A4R5CQS5_9ACTN|nr:helix-turn-helix domain-containing protein [Jiangella asiatica]TDE00774.1 transcriptional regulator [Jiangella asiatica]